MTALPTQAPTPTDAPLLAVLRALREPDPEAAREEVQAALNRWRDARLAGLKAKFERDGDAAALVQGLSAVMDEVIASLYHLLIPNAHGVTVAATGGYGRAELFPYSDIDLLILYRPAARKYAERMARILLYLLWDLGLKVGHALRGVDDTLALAREDITIRTNLIDSRLVVGDAALFEEFSSRFQQEIVEGSAEEFVEKKLAEREERHRRYGDSRYLLEPNLKESKGGLRDLHIIYWLARYVYGVRDVDGLVEKGLLAPEEYEMYARARMFYWHMRAHLHYLAGKPEERLTFDRQQALAARLKFRGNTPNRAVERLMRRYFMTAAGVGGLTRILCALLEDQHKRKPRLPLAARLAQRWKLSGFVLDGERLTVKNEDEFARDPVRMLELFRVAQEYGCDIHPHALRWVARHLESADRAFTQDRRAAALFMEILLAPTAEQTLRRMNEVGLLGRFIPDFGRIVGQMQFNMYHIYTVDEHIIVALGVLHGIEAGKYREEMPLASDLIRRIGARRVLFLSLLCHDIAKGRHGDHSEIGASIALKLARRFGLPADEAETAAWLVRNHLIFTDTAFKRDAADPQTIRDFAQAVQSVERLRLLLLLTVADMRAVGPGVWNAWKAALIRNLYQRTEEYMMSGKLISGEAERVQLHGALAALLPHWDADALNAYLSLGGTDYLESLDAASHARLAELLKRVHHERLPLAIAPKHDTKRGITELAVVTPDSHGLFSKLAGAISLSGANIAGAKIFTLKNGMAVDIFQLQDAEGKAFDRPDRLARLAVKMEQAVTGAVDLARELKKQKQPSAQRREAFHVQGQVFLENDASSTHTVVEVVGRDRIGFLHAVTRALSEQALTIGSAHISTYGVQAVDVFYVKDIFGMKVTHEKKLLDLREALLAVVNEA